MVKKVLILLPTYNEGENLSRLCEEILTVVPYAHILIIDDNSPDGTGRIADGLARKDSDRIFVVHRNGKLGLGTAIMAGFEYAIGSGYEFVVNMDCDFSHDPRDLQRLLAKAADSDLVIASRHIPGGGVVGWNRQRKFLHWLAQKYTEVVLGGWASDYTNSYKAYRVEMLKKLPFTRFAEKVRGFVWHTLLIWMIHKKGFRISEIPSIFVDRRAGESKMSFKEMASGLWAILKFRFLNV